MAEYIVRFYDGRVRRLPGPLRELQKLEVETIEEAGPIAKKVEMPEGKEYMLGIGGECPKCLLGKGLREIVPIELALTGLENYSMLHCDTCGANFVKRRSALLWEYMNYQAPKLSE